MAESKAAQSTIRRKVEGGRQLADGAPMTSSKALVQALGKSAQDLMALALRVGAVSQTRLSLAELIDSLEEAALLAVLEGPQDSLGLAVLSPTVLAGLIEMQTMGRLGLAPAPRRRPTRTDAAMSAAFIDGFLREFEQSLAETAEITWAHGYRYASFLDDPRPLGLLLEDVSYRAFKLDLQLGAGGARQGTMVLALPALGRGAGVRASAASGALAPTANTPARMALADEAALWEQQMERMVMAADVRLEAVLARISLPLQAVMDLRVGMQLPIPLAAMEQLRIEGLGGHVVAQARLGQNRGFRAVRINAAEGRATELDASPPHEPEAAYPRALPESPKAAPHVTVPAKFAAAPDLPSKPYPSSMPDPDAEPDDVPLAPLKMGSIF